MRNYQNDSPSGCTDTTYHSWVMYESSSCTICMNIWCCQDLNLRHLYGWREVSHCGFNLHSLMTNHLLYVFIFVVHIYIYWFFQLLPLLSLCCRPYSYIQNRSFNWYVYFSHAPSKKKKNKLCLLQDHDRTSFSLLEVYFL